jgi:hypothetical protein
MAASHFQQFLDEATHFDPDTDSPLGPDCLYGLYTSWCLLHGIKPKPDTVFRVGMNRCGIDIHNSSRSMCGAAAADYILFSYPSAV